MVQCASLIAPYAAVRFAIANRWYEATRRCRLRDTGAFAYGFDVSGAIGRLTVALCLPDHLTEAFEHFVQGVVPVTEAEL